MTKEYFMKLYQQYISATHDYSLRVDDFANYIVSNQKLLIEYRNLLRGLDYFAFSDAIEIGKGPYDTIKGTLIEKASNYLESKDGILICKEQPYLVKNNGLAEINQKVILTHNPYEEIYYRLLGDIHNKSQYDISLGVFGRIYDDDFKKKYDMMQNTSKLMSDDHEFDYELNSGNYFITINSKRKKKMLLRGF